jgi:hypothetical protein
MAYKKIFHWSSTTNLKDESTTRAAAAKRTKVGEIVKDNDAGDEEKWCTGHEVEPAQRTTQGSQTYQDECNANDLVKVYRREFMIQASLYVLAYFVTNFFPWYLVIVFEIMKQQPSDMSLLMTSIFYPLGGLFNILVYTRPKDLSLRRKNPRQYSWFQAFVIVIRAGAVVPMVVVVEEGNSPSAARESPAGLLQTLQICISIIFCISNGGFPSQVCQCIMTTEALHL